MMFTAVTVLLAAARYVRCSTTRNCTHEGQQYAQSENLKFCRDSLQHVWHVRCISTMFQASVCFCGALMFRSSFPNISLQRRLFNSSRSLPFSPNEQTNRPNNHAVPPALRQNVSPQPCYKGPTRSGRTRRLVGRLTRCGFCRGDVGRQRRALQRHAGRPEAHLSGGGLGGRVQRVGREDGFSRSYHSDCYGYL